MSDFWSKDLQAAKAAERSGPEGSKASTATSQATTSAAQARYAERRAKADAERAEADAAAAQAGLTTKQKEATLNLTPGQKKADETYATDYNEWIVNGEYATVVQNLKTLKSAIKTLRSGKTLSGNIVGRLPEFVQKALYGDDPKAMKDAIDQLTVGSLRTILGSQFTEKEGARIQAQSYDITSGEESNVRKIDKSIDELLGRAMAKQAAAQYFSENGTLAGYTGVNPLALGAWDNSKVERAKKDFGLVFGEEEAKSPFEIIEELKPTTETRVGASETYVSAEAKRLASAMDKAWREGASVEDMIAMNPGVDRKALAEAEKYRNLEEPVYAKFAPYESERPASLIGSAADNAILGPAIAAITSATPGGSIEQIARLTGGDPEKTAFALDYLKGKYPVSSSFGEFGGEFGRSVLGAKALTSLGMSALPATFATETGLSALEGGLEARPGETLAGTLIGGGRGAVIGALPVAASRAFSPKTPEAVLDMRERGVPLSVGQTLGVPNMEANIAKLLPVGGDVTLAAQRRAFADLPRAYLDEAGSYIKAPALDKTIKPTERFGQTQKAFNEAYEKAKSNMFVARDEPFDTAVAEFRARLKNGVDFDPVNAKRLEKLLDDTVVRRLSGKPSGDTYKSLDSLLGKRRAAFGKAQNDELVAGVDEMQRILRANATRHSDPAAVKFLDDVDEGYSYLIRGEEAAKAAGTPAGEFSPSQLLKAVQKGDISARGRAFARGEARGQEFAERGVEALGKGATDVAPIERGVGLFAGPTILSPVNAAFGIANAPGVRPALNTLIAGQRPEFMKGTGDLIAQYPALFSGAIGGADEVSLMLQNTPTDIEALLERYNYTPQTGGEGIPQVGPELTEAQRNYALQSAAREPAAVPAAEVAPVAETAAVIPEKGVVMFEGKAVEYDPETDTFVELATNRRVKDLAELSRPPAGMYRGGSVQEFAMGGMAHSLGAEVPEIMVPLRASAPAQDVVVPMAMRRGGTVQAFRNGGNASIADMARHYGMRR
jgi:hypothetical protein